MNDAEVNLQVVIDGKQTSKAMSNLETRADKLAKSFKNAGKVLTVGLTLPIVAFGVNAVKAASDLGETINKVDVAFQKNSKEVKEWAKTSIKQFGMAQQTALDMTALYGDMATGMGMNTKEAAKLGTGLTGLAGDIASFKNVRLDVAKTALAGVFTGETESLKQLGIIMTQTNLEQYALSKGMKSNIADMTEAEKIQLRYAFVTDRSKNAIGDFARTSDSTANRIRMAQEQFKELSAELGENLLPMVNKVLGVLSGLIDKFNSLDESGQNVVLVVAGIVAGLGPLMTIISAISTFITSIVIPAITAIATALGISVGWVVAAVAAIVAIVVLVIAYWDEIVAGLKVVWQWIVDLFTKIGEFFKGIWDSIVTFFTPFVEFFKGIFDKVVGVIKWFWDFFYNIFLAIVAIVAMVAEKIWGFIKPVIDAVVGAFNWLWGIISNVFSSIWETIKNVFSSIWNFISPIIDKIVSAFKKVGEFIGNVFKGVRDAIANVFQAIGGIIKTPINAIINLINGVLKGLNKLKVPDWVPGIGGKGVNIPLIPTLATGTNFFPKDRTCLLT